MRVVVFSEARKSLKTSSDETVAEADFTIIRRRDAPDAVVMSLDTFNSLMETVHLVKTPANAAHLAESIEQYRDDYFLASLNLLDQPRQLGLRFVHLDDNHLSPR